MKNILMSIFALALILGLSATYSYAQTVSVRWLQPDGAANSTCGIQAKELQKAINTLNKSLHKSGMSAELGYLKFTGQKPTGDNASVLGLWINNRPFESWVQASVNNAGPCPETVVEGTTYKLIPSELIVKAGLAAADQMSKRQDKNKTTKLSSR
jgi:hypothetical protein